jgi:hypothetical protein
MKGFEWLRYKCYHFGVLYEEFRKFPHILVKIVPKQSKKKENSTFLQAMCVCVCVCVCV